MRPNARQLRAILVLLIVPMLLSGCITCWENWRCNRYPPRMAALHVYVYDYYSGYPITWATVELYEQDWWNWDYLGSWHVNPAGYTTAHGGYLYHDDCCGSDEETFRVEVYASGYYWEDYCIELSYHYPVETLTFYLVPWPGRGEGDAEIDETTVPELPLGERPADRVIVGEGREKEGGDPY